VVAEPGDGGGDVELDRRRIGAAEVIRIREVVVALRDAGGAAEVVERDRADVALGEAECELLVEAVQAANVGQDDDAFVRRRIGCCGERREAIPVGRFQDEVLVRDRRAGDARDRRRGIEVEAHAFGSLTVVHLVTGTVPFRLELRSYLL
jgi:hypothetical protein